MAVSTSPYVQNDYQSAAISYQLPVNDILNPCSSKPILDQGALKVKIGIKMLVV